MLVFLFVLYKISVVQVVCAYRLVSGLFWGKIGMDNSLICLSFIFARVNYNVLNMCHANIHYCSYNYLILILFVYNSSSVCVLGFNNQLTIAIA